jgi:alpha-galactosidase
MERNMRKIVLIGAGSARFALQMITDLCLTPGLKGWEIVLVDPDTTRLGWICTLAGRLKDELGVELTFSKETDRRRALEGASFVINTALAGGRGMMDQDRALLESYGYYRGIGVNTPHRQLQLMLDIAHDVADLCPEAVILQAGNPVPEGCTLMYRETGVRVIGICHGYLEYHYLARLLGIDPHLVTCEAIGINHCIWATRFELNGEDLYPRLHEWKHAVAPAFYRYWRSRNADYQLSKVAWHLLDLYGLMPIGDTTRAIWPDVWWYHTSLEMKQQWYGPTGGWDSELGHQNNLDWLAGTLTQIQEIVTRPDVKIAEAFPLAHSEWQIVPIIDSIANNRRHLYQVNIPNQGVIPALPDDFVIEVPAYVDASGCYPAVTKPLTPLVWYGAILPRWLLAERIVMAMQTGDRRYLLQTYLSDHKTLSFEQATSALDALITAPWNADMAAHYGAGVQQASMAVQDESNQLVRVGGERRSEEH